MNQFKTNQINTLQFFSLLRFPQFISMILIGPWQLFVMNWLTQLKRSVASNKVSKYGPFYLSDMNLQSRSMNTSKRLMLICQFLI